MGFSQLRIFLFWGFVYFVVNTILTAVFDTITSAKISILVSIFSAGLTAFLLTKKVYPKEAIKGAHYTPLITGAVLSIVALIYEYAINFIAFYDSNLLRFASIIISSAIGGKLAIPEHKYKAEKKSSKKPKRK